MKTTASLLFFVLTASIVAVASEAHAGNSFPSCQSDRVLGKIVRQFNRTEREYWSERGLVLQEVGEAHQHSENPFWESPVNRRYCHGDAHFADGRKHRIHYLIEEAGFAGYGWKVEYCIHGLDPWKYYDGRCRVLSR